MALYDAENSPAPAVLETVLPKIQPTEFDGITIDTSYAPSSALLTWVEGSNWTVDYFSQVLGADVEPTPQAIEREPIYQQYKRIKGMHLKVTTPIGFSQEAPINSMLVTGAALTYPFLIPNYGDMFIADIGDGRAGIFTVTRATRQTILRDTVYAIEYELVSELTTERLNDLERKTIQTFFYSQASMITGCGPFVTEEAQVRQDLFQRLYLEMVARYLTDFFSIENSTLLIPDQLKPAYDHFVTRFLLSILDSTMDKRIRRIREMNISLENVMTQPTLWDGVQEGDAKKLYGATRKAHLVSTRFFRGQPNLQALGYTGIDRLAFPIEAPTDVDSQYDHEDRHRPPGIPFREGRPRRPLPGPYVDQATRNAIWFQPTPLMDGVPPWKLPPDIHPVVIDEYYVLSEAFYNEDAAHQSKLEMLVWQALKHEALNLDQLEGCLERALDWDNLERYYYYPLVFMLLKVAGAR